MVEAGGAAVPGPAADQGGANDESSSEDSQMVGFWGSGGKKDGKVVEKKSAKDKKKEDKIKEAAKKKKSKKDSGKKKKSKKDKKKKKKSTSSSSSSSSSSDSSSSVFRVAKTGHDRISQARLIQWAEDHPGKVALELLRKMHAIVGQDGEKVKKIGSAPAVAKQYDLRVLRAEGKARGQSYLRNQRELTTLCVVLDHMALGRYKQAADVVAARLKSVESGTKDGHFHQSSFLELVPVNPEGLTTVDENLLVRNEAHLNPPPPRVYDADWTGQAKGKGYPQSSWIPSGNGKGKKEGGKGKKGSKGKKGDKKG